MRHRSPLAELGDERVDIVHWDAEPQKFVAAALGQATVVVVAIDSDTRTAHDRVQKDQLSLAIARDGQNARLAAKLTGWRVDIKPAENGAPKTKRERRAPASIAHLAGMLRTLHASGTGTAPIPISPDRSRLYALSRDRVLETQPAHTARDRPPGGAGTRLSGPAPGRLRVER